MNANPSDPTTEGGGGGLSAKTLRALIGGGVVLIIAVVAFFIWRGVEADAQADSWDKYHVIRKDNEPGQDPLWNDLYGVFGAQRDRYVKALEAFLEAEAKGSGETLEADVRWRIAKTLADHVLSQRDLTDATKRRDYYDRALAQMEKIRDDFPNYPLNWDMWKPSKFPSLTRKFVDWLQKNKEWEAEHLPMAREPDGEHTVVFRTTAGDLRAKLYVTDAKAWTDGFLARAISGGYDGTAIFEKREIGDAADPKEHAVRGGSDASRDRATYDANDHLTLAEDPRGGGLLPGEARNKIPHDRGIMAAWHDGATEYDDAVQFMFIVRDSQQLDYDYTPVGKLVDDASLTTLDEIFRRKTWRIDPKINEDAGELRQVLDFFQVPVVIKKVLVYDAAGKLVEPEAGKASASRDPATTAEQSLSTLDADAYKVPVPEKPAPDNGGDEKAPGPDENK
ncbi:MAG: peptidylprolyl isomerase [Planctomycetota bacterium]|nr:peptidylprolyl isomerase [Planctomycetota bacterium]